jgi:N-acetylglucosaminyl-diphospho-decaprenol L-rhamnosyltransferase
VSKLVRDGIGIVIVSYNSAGSLAPCIAAVHAQAEAASLRTRILVVDNNSRDDSIDVATKNGVATITNAVNLGFAAAANQGIRALLSQRARYVLILNPDVVLKPGSLVTMLDCIRTDRRVGAVGPNLRDKRGNPANAGYYRKAPSWVSTALFLTSLQARALRHPSLVERFYGPVTLDASREVEQIPGACLLTSRETLDEVGLLDEDFAIWFEDVDWCYRARKLGYVMWFCAEADVEHEGGASFKQWRGTDRQVAFCVSMMTFFNKHKPLSGVLVRLAISINALAQLVRQRNRSSLAFLKGFWTLKRGVLPE